MTVLPYLNVFYIASDLLMLAKSLVIEFFLSFVVFGTSIITGDFVHFKVILEIIELLAIILVWLYQTKIHGSRIQGICRRNGRRPPFSLTSEWHNEKILHLESLFSRKERNCRSSKVWNVEEMKQGEGSNFYTNYNFLPWQKWYNWAGRPLCLQ